MKNELCTAIVEITKGVDSILNLAELIGELTHSLPPEDSHHIMKYITQLSEASTFQDIAVQRLTKVIRVLKELDSYQSRVSCSTTNDEILSLYGPQSKKTALPQTEINASLKENRKD